MTKPIQGGFCNPEEKVACLDLARVVLRGISVYKPSDPSFVREHKLDIKWLDENNREDITQIAHISMNYGFIMYRRTLAKHTFKPVMVIRTEHICDDLQNLETALGGTRRITRRMNLSPRPRSMEQTTPWSSARP